MKIRTLLPRLLSLGAGALLATTALAAEAASTQPQVWHEDLDAARRAAAAAGELLLVDLYADWCTWCKVIEEKVFETPEFTALTAGKVTLARLDYDHDPQAKRLADRFRVDSLPTVLVVTPDLAEVGIVRGMLPKTSYLAKLQIAIGSHAQMEQRIARDSASSDPAVRRRLADDLRRIKDGKRAAPLYAALAEQAKGVERKQLLYLIAESHWLAGQLPEARRALGTVVGQLGGGDEELAQHADLLRFRLAHDGGQCQEAKAALKHFLAEHPQSNFTPSARNTLASLDAGQQAPCT